MIPALLLVLETIFKLAKAHPDLVEALAGKALGAYLAGSKHDDAAAQAGLAQGLAALAASAATTAAEREKRKAAQANADRVARLSLPLAEEFPEDSTLAPTGSSAREDVAALVAALNRVLGADLICVCATIDPLSPQPKEIQS